MTERDRERWVRVSELFARVIDLTPDARSAFIRDAAGGDREIESELRSLLEAHERASTRGFLDVPAAALDPGLAPDDSAHMIGRTIGQYLIRSEIGRGGMGVVFCAEDTRLGRTVALKAVAPDLARDARMRERLRREARAAAALSHPAIATVYALEESGGELFIASEYVKGHTLREEIGTTPADPRALVETARAIAGALAAAHAQGIVHRDLKPENVIRREDGQVKVLDFGLARTFSGERMAPGTRLTMTGFALGTPGYMAPEQLRGEAVDARADIFAFGVLMYELATGHHPSAIAPASGSGALTGRRLDAIIRKCLQPAPADRFSTGAELLAALMSDEDPAAFAPVLNEAGLWWWQFHQLAIAAFHSSMLVALWLVRDWFPAPWGNGVFYAGLASQTAAVTMRLHLWFSSRFDRDVLPVQRARVHRPLVLLDLVYQALLFATGLAAAIADAGAAPLFVVAGIASFLVLVLIEPATTHAAFRRA
ncbi:MAG TPA: serine/threonine-protein kinase [Vicinamibacterales bacterium]|nr:serine/threonine-protein kinase [Vicinamibacterales bacterium]